VSNPEGLIVGLVEEAEAGWVSTRVGGSWISFVVEWVGVESFSCFEILSYLVRYSPYVRSPLVPTSTDIPRHTNGHSSFGFGQCMVCRFVGTKDTVGNQSLPV
jgi:hypothetical protein